MIEKEASEYVMDSSSKPIEKKIIQITEFQRIIQQQLKQKKISDFLLMKEHNKYFMIKRKTVMNHLI